MTVGFSGGAELQKPSRDGRTAVLETHALLDQLELRFRIDELHLTERVSEDTLEVVHASIAMTELLFQRRPGDKGSLAVLDPVQALREPGVNVERHGIVREASHGRFIERYRVLH